MMKYLRLTWLAIMLAAILLIPLPVAGASGVQVTESQAVADFPLRLTFSLSARADQPVTDVRLHYQVQRRSFAEVVSEVKLGYPPATRIDAEYTLDMRRIGGYPPGTAVDYWWTLADANGAVTRTGAQRIVIEDSRYSWNRLSQGLVTVYWYRGDRAFGEKLLAAAVEATSRLTLDAGIRLEDPIDVYIYGSYADLQQSMVFANEWTGGRAYSAYDAVVIGISPVNLTWGINAVSHEIGHLVTGQVSNNPFLGLPVWLNEGLAVSAQPTVDPGYLRALQTAQSEGNLISLRSLTSPFSADSATVSLSYAQSWSVVQYMSEEYGQDKINRLLERFSQGIGYDELLIEIYGFDMDELNRRWLQAVADGSAAGFRVRVL
jgi:hypothetical protein